MFWWHTLNNADLLLTDATPSVSRAALVHHTTGLQHVICSYHGEGKEKWPILKKFP